MRIILLAVFFIFISLEESKTQNYYGDSESNVFDFSINNEGNLIALPFESKIELWTIENPRLVSEFKEIHTNSIRAINFSNSGNFIVSGGKDSLLVVWNSKSGLPLFEAKPHSGIILSVKFSPNDKFIASAATDKNVVITDSKTGEIITVFKGHTDDVLDVEFIDDNLIATCSADGSIIIWELSLGKKINQWSAHKTWVRDISVSPNRTKILSCGDDGRIKRWDISNLANIQLLSEQKVATNWLTTIDCSDDNSFGFAGHNKRVKIVTPFNIYTLRLKCYINKIEFIPDRKYMSLIIATYGGGIFHYDAREMKAK